MLAIEQEFGVDLMQKGIKIEDTKSPRSLAAAVWRASGLKVSLPYFPEPPISHWN